MATGFRTACRLGGAGGRHSRGSGRKEFCRRIVTMSALRFWEGPRIGPPGAGLDVPAEP